MTDLTHSPHPFSDDDPPAPDACAHCGGGLAADQRWCLECGGRRPQLASPFAAPSAPPPPPPGAAPPLPGLRAAGPAGRQPEWLMGAVITAVSALLFAVGLLVGLAGRDPRTTVTIPAAKAPVVNVSVPAGAGGGAAVGTTTAVETGGFTSDWPEGEKGFTVQLESLSKDAKKPDAVAAAKTSAEKSGAKDVGALDSDEYASLSAGRYIVYSGVFKTKAAAAKALKPLKKDFPKAKVIQVSATAGDDEPAKTVSKSELQKQENLSPEEFQEQSKKQPEKVGTEGATPPPDNKAPGGGSEGTEIG